MATPSSLPLRRVRRRTMYVHKRRLLLFWVSVSVILAVFWVASGYRLPIRRVAPSLPPPSTSAHSPPRRYLTYAAHSGLANQIIQLFTAYDVARTLDRTLVLPPVLPHFAVKLGACERLDPVASAHALREQNRRVILQLLDAGAYVSLGEVLVLEERFTVAQHPSTRAPLQAAADCVREYRRAPAQRNWAGARCHPAGMIEYAEYVSLHARHNGSYTEWPYSCHQARLVIDLPADTLRCTEAYAQQPPRLLPREAYATAWRTALAAVLPPRMSLPAVMGVCETLHARSADVLALGSVFHSVHYAGVLVPASGGWTVPYTQPPYGGRYDFFRPRLGGRYGQLARHTADRVLAQWLMPSAATPLLDFVCVHVRGGDGPFRRRLLSNGGGGDDGDDSDVLQRLGLSDVLATNTAPVLLITDLPRELALALRNAMIGTQRGDAPVEWSQQLVGDALPRALQDAPLRLGPLLMDVALCSRARRILPTEASTFSRFVQALQRTLAEEDEEASKNAGDGEGRVHDSAA
ncbi:hypothetical protein CDCA_CDCA13G3705 [Cyanidium caldarium]|uniref:O-fucosyltransferase family protein n=1 Tax=Cyanidium caldarium TaxID=2771 RepID=A0AAV9IZB8_CYACA|nr:hypothetical protein CDCA_CDCA13G3705 [Cyanidium caldarium]